jgi:GT2 family glycosyltransferase
VLYHWRAIPGSTALASDEKNYAAVAARKAIQEHLQRTGRGGTVTAAPEAPALNRVRYPLPIELPLVSIIIPTRDRADILGVCLESVLQKTSYPHFEIIVVDNGSVEAKTQQLLDRQPKDKVRVVRDDAPFNYSRLNNLAVQAAKGEVVCLMNNDIEVLTPDWLEEMLSFALQPDIGCVGARLWYPGNGGLQHGGVILGIGGIAGHSHKYLPRRHSGYLGRAVLHQSFSAVTAACLLVRREIWEKVQGLDESFAVAFNDVDFCLRVRETGYRNVWTPYAEMIHHESVSRGPEDNPEKVARFQGEIKRMHERWGDALSSDPAYSVNLTYVHEDFSLGWR